MKLFSENIVWISQFGVLIDKLLKVKGASWCFLDCFKVVLLKKMAVFV